MLTTKETMEALGCSSSTLSQYVRSGALKYVKKGAGTVRPSFYLFDEDEVQAFKEKMRKKRGIPSDDFVGIIEAIKMTGLSQSDLAKLVESGELHMIKGKSTNGYNVSYYDKSDLKRIRGIYGVDINSVNTEGLLTVQEVADILQCSTTLVIHKVYDGELDAVIAMANRARPGYFFKPEDIMALKSKFDPSRDEMLYKQLAVICGCEVKTISDWTKAGHIKTTRVFSSRNVIEKEDAEKFLDSVCKRGDWRTDKYLSYDQAIKKTGLSRQTLFNMLEDGRLSPGMVLPSGRIRFLESDLNNFVKGGD